ncbi:MAG TPA: hypothetical protein VMH48_01285 [Methylomirabilota bacterium]|nr:hypothetical protein [Methylomirabilota bacterium]
MKKKAEKRDELRPEYDLSKSGAGVRGKHFRRYRAGTNLVLLALDVAAYFPDEKAVNAALRTLIRVGKRPRPASTIRAGKATYFRRNKGCGSWLRFSPR